MVYVLINGVEFVRIYNADGLTAVDYPVTPAIQATADYIANHTAQEAVSLATDDANNLTADPVDPIEQAADNGV